MPFSLRPNQVAGVSLHFFVFLYNGPIIALKFTAPIDQSLLNSRACITIWEILSYDCPRNYNNDICFAFVFIEIAGK